VASLLLIEIGEEVVDICTGHRPPTFAKWSLFGQEHSPS
jgi:hypothetical protein